METALKALMLRFHLQTESALFVSDLKFKLCDAKLYKNLPGSKSDDTLCLLNAKLSHLVDKYRLKMGQLIAEKEDKDVDARTNVSVGVYLVTYYHGRNASCVRYVE